MTAARSPRWLMSFADLTLLLLACFVLLHARGSGQATASMRAAFGGASTSDRTIDLPATALFAGGEAVLRPGAAERLRAMGARWREGRVRVTVGGNDARGLRLDAWELAAARLAVIARGLAAGGIDAQRIDVALPATAEARAGAQHFAVSPL